MTTEQLNVVLTFANLLIATVSLISAIAVPFISIWVSQRLAAIDSKQREGRALLLKINQDMQNFRTILLDSHPAFQRPTDSEDVANERARSTRRAIQDQITILNGDRLSLGLLFDEHGNSLGKKLQDLISEAEGLMARQPPPPIDDADNYLQAMQLGTAKEMRALRDVFMAERLWSRKKRVPTIISKPGLFTTNGAVAA